MRYRRLEILQESPVNDPASGLACEDIRLMNLRGFGKEFFRLREKSFGNSPGQVRISAIFIRKGIEDTEL